MDPNQAIEMISDVWNNFFDAVNFHEIVWFEEIRCLK